MSGADTGRPAKFLRLNGYISAVVGIDLVMIGRVKLVVRDLEPIGCEVDSCFTGNDQEEKGTFVDAVSEQTRESWARSSDLATPTLLLRGS